MRVLCAVGQRSGPELVKRLAEVIRKRAELLLLQVVDTGPRHDLKHLLGPLRHGPPGGPEREREITAAEEAVANASLAEAKSAAEAAGFIAHTSLMRGRPEEVILKLARDEEVSLICISAQEGAEGHPHLGPASVGHTARFVLDHAPCDVLLLREYDQG